MIRSPSLIVASLQSTVQNVSGLQISLRMGAKRRPRQAQPDQNMSIDDKVTKLSAFSHWVKDHTIGDEKGEAQIFLDRLFIAFGWPGLKEAGASCEKRIKNTTGGTSFADLVWKPVVVIEMKKRGVDLSKHYTQAFTYWTRLVPNRPRYAVLCNFDEFWIYDFDNCVFRSS